MIEYGYDPFADRGGVVGLKRKAGTAEEIEHRYTAIKSDGSGRYLMVIRGQVGAVMAVAEKLREAGRIISYSRHSAVETALVFPADAFKNMEPIDVFREIQATAWSIIDPRGQR